MGIGLFWSLNPCLNILWWIFDEDSLTIDLWLQKIATFCLWRQSVRTRVMHKMGYKKVIFGPLACYSYIAHYYYYNYNSMFLAVPWVSCYSMTCSHFTFIVFGRCLYLQWLTFLSCLYKLSLGLRALLKATIGVFWQHWDLNSWPYKHQYRGLTTELPLSIELLVELESRPEISTPMCDFYLQE